MATVVTVLLCIAVAGGVLFSACSFAYHTGRIRVNNEHLKWLDQMDADFGDLLPQYGQRAKELRG